MDITYVLTTLFFTKSHLFEDIVSHYLHYIIPCIIIYVTLNNITIKYFIFDYLNSIFTKKITGSITMTSCMNKHTTRYKAILWYICEKQTPCVKKLNEVYHYKYYNDHTKHKLTNHFFMIKQNTPFQINKDLYAHSTTYTKKIKLSYSNEMVEQEVNEITIYSYTLHIKQIITFLDAIVQSYKKNFETKKLETQHIIECTFNEQESKFINEFIEWNSNTTFENKFFTNKEEIISQIDFFINNPDYFKSRGIPYHLGILLHGEPGCGKTSFIKALANKTKRHIINIKIDNNVDMQQLKNLLFNNEINDDIYIPIHERLYVLEDIDAMGSILHKRNTLKNEEIKNDSHEEFIEIIKKSVIKDGYKKNVPQNNTKNTLGYFLNIIDGIQENHGRIIIMTTNHIDNLDPAILRPGRVDLNIKFTKANKEVAKQLLQHFWSRTQFVIPYNYEPIPHCKIIEYCRSSKTLEETLYKLTPRQGSTLLLPAAGRA